MNWNPWSKKFQPPPRVHVVQAKPQSVNIKRETGGEFRAGMWVVLGERVGILKDMNEFAVATVMLVDAEGFNELEIPVPIGELRQAYLKEIPKKRIKGLHAEHLNRLGYK